MVLENRVWPKSKTRNNKKWRRTGKKPPDNFLACSVYSITFSHHVCDFMSFPLFFYLKISRGSLLTAFIFSPHQFMYLFSAFFIRGAPIYRKSKYFFSTSLFIVIIIKSSMIGSRIRCVFRVREYIFSLSSKYKNLLWDLFVRWSLSEYMKINGIYLQKKIALRISLNNSWPVRNFYIKWIISIMKFDHYTMTLLWNEI